MVSWVSTIKSIPSIQNGCAHSNSPYYQSRNLWVNHPDTLWAYLAAARLELK